MRGLKDKRIVLTGGASGIGHAIALRLGEEGAVVGILDRNGDGARSVAAEIEAAGGRAFGHACDITDYAQVQQAVDAFAAQAGGIDGLVNNAGWDKVSSFLDSGPELWKQVIDINLYGPIHVTHAVAQRLSRQGHGRVVSIASDAGRVGSSGESVYSACKAGVIALMKTAAREMARQGITFNAVCPGPSDTPLFREFDPSGKLTQALERAIPMRRLGRPDDLPGIVCFLLSDDAGFITGQTISVSGGLTMHG